MSRRVSGAGAGVLGIVALLAALSLVTWRQARALEELARVDRLHRELSLVQAQNGDLTRRIQFLESRGRVVPEARDRLGMGTPSAAEIVILPEHSP